MEKSNCLLSFCIPVYNCEKYIEECIHSIQKIDFANIEIIVCNDCSADNTVKVLSHLKETDSRIIILDNSQNKGVSYSRNRCIETAKGKYICFVDGDDAIYAETYKDMFDWIELTGANVITGKMHSAFTPPRLGAEHISANDSYLLQSDVIRYESYSCRIFQKRLFCRK